MDTPVHPDLGTGERAAVAGDLAVSIGQALAKQSFCIVPGARVRAELERRVPAASEAWPALAAIWDELALDNHMADGGQYRFRRFSALHARTTAAEPEFESLPRRAFFQSEGYNALNGGVIRRFEALSPADIANPVLQALLVLCSNSLRTASETTAWEVELHPIRTRALGTAEGLATPEGIHQDGVDYFFVVMLERRNIRGGESLVFDASQREVLRHTLKSPFEILAVHDPETFHSVTPFLADLPDHGQAWRDVIVINFRDASRPDRRL
jgi:hypothetical protein